MTNEELQAALEAAQQSCKYAQDAFNRIRALCGAEFGETAETSVERTINTFKGRLEAAQRERDEVIAARELAAHHALALMDKVNALGKERDEARTLMQAGTISHNELQTKLAQSEACCAEMQIIIKDCLLLDKIDTPCGSAFLAERERHVKALQVAERRLVDLLEVSDLIDDEEEHQTKLINRTLEVIREALKTL